MLTRNAISLGSNPQRFMGAALAVVVHRGEMGRNGSLRNIWAGQATVISGASIADTAAYPNGYEPPGSWCMAPKGGGLSCYNNISGEGSLTITSLSMGQAVDAALTGSGTISAASLSLIIQLAATLAGIGSLTSSLQAVASLAGALTGTGTISAANMSLIVSMASAMVGSGDLDATLRGTGNMSADIVVTGDILSTANVGAAVWAEILETGYTAEHILRIIAAATAGETSGGAAGFTARNLANTQNQIVGTADSSGNRTPTSYGT